MPAQGSPGLTYAFLSRCSYSFAMVLLETTHTPVQDSETNGDSSSHRNASLVVADLCHLRQREHTLHVLPQVASDQSSDTCDRRI